MDKFWTWVVRVAAGMVIGAVLGCAASVIKNGNRLTALETRVPLEYGHIMESLNRIEKKVDTVVILRYAGKEKE